MTSPPAEPTTEELTEHLAERLDRIARNGIWRYTPRDNLMDCVIHDRLASLTAAKDAAERQVEELRRALEPFAKEALFQTGSDYAYIGGNNINVGMLRTADRALAATAPKEKDR